MKFWGLLIVVSFISLFGDRQDSAMTVNPIHNLSVKKETLVGYYMPVFPKPRSKPSVFVSYPTPPPWISAKILAYIDTEANNPQFKTKVPILLIYKLIEWESGWRQSAYHHNTLPDGYIWSTDWGIMQECDAYIPELIHEFRDPGRKEKSYDVIHNVYDNLQIGIRKLRHMYDTFGTWTKAIAAYNAGITTVSLGAKLKPPTRRELHHVIPVEAWWTRPDGVEIIYNRYIY